MVVVVVVVVVVVGVVVVAYISPMNQGYCYQHQDNYYHHPGIKHSSSSSSFVLK